VACFFLIEQKAIRYASTMFVRFRQQGRRLQASLMQTRRVAGTMRSEHIASLGSVDAEVSVRERLAFWAKLPQRLARLGNRVGPAEGNAAARQPGRPAARRSFPL
jgi:hypothetical protein